LLFNAAIAMAAVDLQYKLILFEEVRMTRLLSIMIVIVSVFIASCATVPVKAVKPGGTLTPDNGYIALVFTNKVEFFSFGSRYVYAVLRHADTGRRFYIPFGAGDEPRLIAALAGNYRIEDFVYMTGLESVTGEDPSRREPGVLTMAPLRSGTSLVSAAFADDYCMDFAVAAGEIVYIGDYSWKNTFTFSGKAAVTIERSIRSDDAVLSLIREVYPDIPASITFVSLT
jgi:hypothetical protein